MLAPDRAFEGLERLPVERLGLRVLSGLEVEVGEVALEDGGVGVVLLLHAPRQLDGAAVEPLGFLVAAQPAGDATHVVVDGGEPDQVVGPQIAIEVGRLDQQLERLLVLADAVLGLGQVDQRLRRRGVLAVEPLDPDLERKGEGVDRPLRVTRCQLAVPQGVEDASLEIRMLLAKRSQRGERGAQLLAGLLQASLAAQRVAELEVGLGQPHVGLGQTPGHLDGAAEVEGRRIRASRPFPALAGLQVALEPGVRVGRRLRLGLGRLDARAAGEQREQQPAPAGDPPLPTRCRQVSPASA